MSTKTFNPETWEWFGHTAHFCCGRWCRFHMATLVGPWLVSTVGLYVHPRNSGSHEKSEQEWLKDNPNGEEVGFGRFFETMVFKAGARCKVKGCNCGLPEISGSELDFNGYKTAGEANHGHMELCRKWSKIAKEPKP